MNFAATVKGRKIPAPKPDIPVRLRRNSSQDDVARAGKTQERTRAPDVDMNKLRRRYEGQAYSDDDLYTPTDEDLAFYEQGLRSLHEDTLNTSDLNRSLTQPSTDIPSELLASDQPPSKVTGNATKTDSSDAINTDDLNHDQLLDFYRSNCFDLRQRNSKLVAENVALNTELQRFNTDMDVDSDDLEQELSAARDHINKASKHLTNRINRIQQRKQRTGNKHNTNSTANVNNRPTTNAVVPPNATGDIVLRNSRQQTVTRSAKVVRWCNEHGHCAFCFGRGGHRASTCVKNPDPDPQPFAMSHS